MKANRFVAMLALSLAAACTGPRATLPPQVDMGVPADATAHPEIWPRSSPAYFRHPETEEKIRALLRRMTVEEKVGQLIQPDIASVTVDEIREYNIGSVLNGGSSGPYGDDFAPPLEWLRLADEFYEASMDTTGGRTAIPIIWGTDAMHGSSNIVGATIFPHNIGLGAMRDTDLIRRIAEITAIEVRVTGQEWTFAPTTAVPQDLRWGRAYEGYSSDPELVSRYVGEFVLGLQGDPKSQNLLATPHVLASAKHFLADGGTFEGRDQGDARIDEAELRDVHGLPYLHAIDAGVGTIMPSFSSWNGTKMTGNRTLLTDVLRDRLGFDGFLISDWNAFAQVEGCSQESCPRALLAGVDMFMAADVWKPLWHSLVEQAKDGTIPVERLDEAVARILRAKYRVGLFDAGKPSSRYLSGDLTQLGSAEHRAVAREAVRKSLVLLKNNGNVLPLDPGSRILVAGDGADDLNKQTGGWTITWQGTDVPREYFPGATSLWEGIRDAVQAGGGTPLLSGDGSFEGKAPDAAIVVFGEDSYAEFEGDINSLQLRPEKREPLAVMEKLRAQGIPVVAVMVTGRPLWVNPMINASDAFVVAWLPGSEGAGVADVLFRNKGDRQYDFTGRLSFDWPLTADAKGPNLFDLGYGLSLSSSEQVPQLSEETMVEDDGDLGTFMRRGKAVSGLSLEIPDPEGSRHTVGLTPASFIGGHLKITAVDHQVQEGARRIAFDGEGAAQVVLAADDVVDLSRESSGFPTAQDGMLVMEMRSDMPGDTPLSLSFGAGGELLDYTLLLSGSDAGWRTYGIPLACFRIAGLDMTRVERIWGVSSNQPFSFSIDKIARSTNADVVLDCPAR